MLWNIQRNKQDTLMDMLREVCSQADELKRQCDELDKEIQMRENEQEPEPERSDEVIKSRKRLKEYGISAVPFYRLFDFKSELDERQTSNLEEALMRMGILDALVVSSDCREEIFNMDTDGCDKYIFTDADMLRDNLSKWLKICNPNNDFLMYEKAAAALSAVSVERTEPKNHTWIAENGSYRIGAIEGSITGKYKACFIGTQARERFRMERIRQLCSQKEQIDRQYAEINQKREMLEGRLGKLKREAEQMPSEDMMQKAASDLAQREYMLLQINREIEYQNKNLIKEKKTLDNISIEVQECCKSVCLPANANRFYEVKDILREVRSGILKVQILHEKFITGIDSIKAQQENVDELYKDLQQLSAESEQIQKEILRLNANLNNVRVQLGLTDYDQIQKRLDACVDRLIKLPDEIENIVSSISRDKEIKKRLSEEQHEYKEKIQRALNKAEYAEKIFNEEYSLDYLGLAEKIVKPLDYILSAFREYGNKDYIYYQGKVQDEFHKNKGFLTEYRPELKTLFDDENVKNIFIRRRIDIAAKYRGEKTTFPQLLNRLKEDEDEQKMLLDSKDRELFEDILANTISRKLRARIHASKRWVDEMNRLMDSMNTSSGLKLSLRWKNRQAEREEQMDTGKLVALLEKDYELMRPEEVEQISLHFRSKIEQARKLSDNTDNKITFHAVMREVLDYRKWFEFRLDCQKYGEKKREMTDRIFFTFSGGEKAMAMYVPLFSAVAAKYSGARADAPHIISLDEAFAGVDDTNICDMFRLMVEFDFDFIINSQVLWGDADSIPAIAIYQLLRPENAKFVTVIGYIWRGKKRIVVNDMKDEAEKYNE